MLAVNKKQHLFEKYAKNLELVVKHRGLNTSMVDMATKEKYSLKYPSYICPLCDRVFSEAAINSEDLTLEHVPPGKLGGRKRLLTCETCNNDQGSTLEKRLVDEVKNSIDGVQNATMQFNKGTKPFVRGTLSTSGNGINFKYWKSNKYFDNQVVDSLHQGEVIQFRFSFKIYPKKVNLALLRVAYLMMFERFGYGYYFSYSGSLIRSQVLSPEKNTLTPVFPSTDQEVAQGIYLLRNGHQPGGFFISVRLQSDGKTRDYYIALPLPDREHMDSYLELRKGEKYQLDLTPLSDIDRISEKANLFRI